MICTIYHHHQNSTVFIFFKIVGGGLLSSSTEWVILVTYQLLTISKLQSSSSSIILLNRCVDYNFFTQICLLCLENWSTSSFIWGKMGWNFHPASKNHVCPYLCGGGAGSKTAKKRSIWFKDAPCYYS